MGTPRIDLIENLSSPNVIINGAMDFWQRGTSIVHGPSTGGYDADRMVFSNIGGGTTSFTMIQDTDVPTQAEAGFAYRYSWKLTCTVAGGAPAAYQILTHKVEGLMGASLFDPSSMWMLSFWVKSTKTGLHVIDVLNSGGSRNYTVRYTINAANTWERKVILIPADPGGGFATGNGEGLRIQFGFGCSASYYGNQVYNTWQTTAVYDYSGGPNYGDSTGNVFRMTGLMLRKVHSGVSLTAPQFVRAGGDIARELILCQRYYEKSYNINQTPGTAGAFGDGQQQPAVTDAGGHNRFYVYYRVVKRAAPTFTPYASAATPTANTLHNWDTGTTAAVSIQSSFDNMITILCAAQTAGHRLQFHWTADAEI